MSAYIIARIAIHDRDEYNRYQAGFRETFSTVPGVGAASIPRIASHVVLAKGRD